MSTINGNGKGKCTWCKHHEMSTETVDEWLERCEGYCDKHDYIVDSLSYSCEHFEAKEGAEV